MIPENILFQFPKSERAKVKLVDITIPSDVLETAAGRSVTTVTYGNETRYYIDGVLVKTEKSKV